MFHTGGGPGSPRTSGPNSQGCGKRGGLGPSGPPAAAGPPLAATVAALMPPARATGQPRL
eukprot:2814132-Alexandrium_andersonii.AAC.1